MTLKVKKLLRAIYNSDDAAIKRLKTLLLDQVHERLREIEACSVVEILSPNMQMQMRCTASAASERD